AIALLALAASAGAAEETIDELVAELQGEPMSLFDWGLHSLEEDLQSVRRNERDFLRVFYEPDQQRIVVDATFLIAPEEVQAVGPKRACYTRHHAIKLSFGVIDTNRIHFAPASDFRLGMKFSHRDSDAYPEMPDAAGVGKRLLDAVFVRVSVATDPDNYPFDLEMRCSGRLVSQEVDYGA
ncbi:MAG: hypothetical protein ACU85V_12160, partial [Gammaproteobacteria bacterium]